MPQVLTDAEETIDDWQTHKKVVEVERGHDVNKEIDEPLANTQESGISGKRS